MRVPANIFELLCELCKGGHHEDQIILCDRCDKGCHMFCVTPPLERVPAGEWICPLCRGEEAASRAFKEGQTLSLADFEKLANDFSHSWLAKHCHGKKVFSRSATPALKLAKPRQSLRTRCQGGCPCIIICLLRVTCASLWRGHSHPSPGLHPVVFIWQHPNHTVSWEGLLVCHSVDMAMLCPGFPCLERGQAMLETYRGRDKWCDRD